MKHVTDGVTLFHKNRRHVLIRHRPADPGGGGHLVEGWYRSSELSSQLLIDSSRHVRLSASRSAFLAATSSSVGGRMIETVRRSGARKIILPSASRTSANLVPILTTAAARPLDDVVLGDLACLDLLVLEDGHGGTSSRLVAVSHAETGSRVEIYSQIRSIVKQVRTILLFHEIERRRVTLVTGDQRP